VKLLNCVFSYNRFFYLKNTVESLIEYFRFGDTMIVDDGSTDAKTVAYLNELERHGVVVIRQESKVREGFNWNAHGGLYENMDTAVQYAISNNYDFIQFIQDDVQFMWHDADLPVRVQHIFEALPDAAQVVNLFFKGVVREETARRLEIIPDAHCYHLRPYGMMDMGINSVPLLKKHSFRFGNGTEKNNSDWWRRRDYKAYLLSSPSMLWVPWPDVIQFDKQCAEGRAPVHKYYLKPLDDEQIGRLANRPLEDIPFAEDYCLPWGWSCPQPYWFTASNPQEYNRLAGITPPSPARPLWWTVGRTVVPDVVKTRLGRALRGLLTSLDQ